MYFFNIFSPLVKISLATNESYTYVKKRINRHSW